MTRGLRAAALVALLAGPAHADEPAGEPVGADEAALAAELIVTVDAIIADLDTVIAELGVAAAEEPQNETLARLLADYRTERDDLAARRAELDAIRAAGQ